MKLKKVNKDEFDPIAEAKAALKYYELDDLALSAYVFGSAVGSGFSAESDIDVLVVVPDPVDVIKAQHNLQRPPFSKWPFDWVLKTQQDFTKRSELGGVCYIAKTAGVKIL